MHERMWIRSEHPTACWLLASCAATVHSTGSRRKRQSPTNQTSLRPPGCPHGSRHRLPIIPWPEVSFGPVLMEKKSTTQTQHLISYPTTTGVVTELRLRRLLHTHPFFIVAFVFVHFIVIQWMQAMAFGSWKRSSNSYHRCKAYSSTW